MTFLDDTGLEHFIDKVRNEAYDAWRDKIQEYIDDSYDYQRFVYVLGDSYLPKSLQIINGAGVEDFLADAAISNTDLFTIVALYSESPIAQTTCDYTFSGCSNLIYADLSWIDFSSCSSMDDMFKNCTMLTTLRIILPDLDIDLSDCPLNEGSVGYIINNLPVSSSGSVLSLSSDSYEYVTDDLAECVEEMGWNVVTQIVISEDGETIVDEEDNIVITE